MSESLTPDNRLVRLHGNLRNLGQQLACRVKLFALNGSLIRIAIGADSHGHDDFFKRGISGPLTDAIDRAFDLTGASRNRSKCIRHRQSEIIMAVGRNYYLVNSPYSLADGPNQIAKFFRSRESNCIGDIYGRCAGINHRLHHFAEKAGISSGRIFRRKLDVLAERLCKSDGLSRLPQAFFPRNLEFVFEVDVGGREEYMDSWSSGTA